MKTILTLTLTLAAATLHAIPLTVITDISAVHAIVGNGELFYQEFKYAGSTNPDVTATAAMGEDASASARLVSFIGATSLSANGALLAQAGLETASQSSVLFDVTFTLSEAFYWHFTGSHGAWGGMAFFKVGDPTPIIDIAKEFGTSGNDLTGQVEAGDYRLAAMARTFVAYGRTDYPGSGTSGFNFTLDFTPVESPVVFQVPETLSTAWLLVPLVGLALLRRRRKLLRPAR